MQGRLWRPSSNDLLMLQHPASTQPPWICFKPSAFSRSEHAYNLNTTVSWPCRTQYRDTNQTRWTSKCKISIWCKQANKQRLDEKHVRIRQKRLLLALLTMEPMECQNYSRLHGNGQCRMSVHLHILLPYPACFELLVWQSRVSVFVES
jgi:hypothetical protein